jgi:hypothetical protein
LASTGRPAGPARRLGEPAGGVVGGAGVAQPHAVLEHGEDLGGEKRPLESRWPARLRRIERRLGELGRRRRSGLGRKAAILDEAEAERVDAGRQLSSAGEQPVLTTGIGEAGAVDVEAEARARASSPSAPSRRRVDQAIFGGVGDRQGGGWTWWTSSRTVSSAPATVSGSSLAPTPRRAAIWRRGCRIRERRIRRSGYGRRGGRRCCRAAGRAPPAPARWPRCRSPPRAPSPRSRTGPRRRVEPLAPGVAVIGGVEPVGGGDRRHHLRAGGRRIVGEEAHGRRARAGEVNALLTASPFAHEKGVRVYYNLGAFGLSPSADSQ